MSAPGVHFTLYRGTGSPDASGASRADVQQFWFTLEKRPWSSLVLVPADRGGSAASIASSLADVGSRLVESPVTTIVAESTDFESARILADLQRRLAAEASGAGADPAASGAARPAEAPGNGGHTAEAGDGVHGGNGGIGGKADDSLMPPGGRVIVALPPVIVEPLGIAIAQVASTVVLCVELRRTHLSALRRTIDLIGRERIAGCCLVS